MSNELIAAIEKAIDTIEEQRISIDRVEAGLIALNMRVKKIESRVEMVDDIPHKLQTLTNIVHSIRTTTNKLRDDLDIVTLDTNAQHQNYEHDQNVLNDWRAEMEADWFEPNLTRTDIADRTTAYNNRRTAVGLHPVYQ